ncbi:MAG: hypothetical protein WDW38_002735 [Sanguina aurantia]
MTTPSAVSEKDLLSQYRVDPYDSSAVIDAASPKPWKKISLAVALLVGGSVLLFTGVGLYVTGRPNVLPMLILGSLAFLPGFYYSRIAYLAWKGYHGYSLDLIPDL